MAWFVRDPSPLLNNHVAVHQEREVLSGKRVLPPQEKEVESSTAAA
jgi:hypothetical protein